MWRKTERGSKRKVSHQVKRVMPCGHSVEDGLHHRRGDREACVANTVPFLEHIARISLFAPFLHAALASGVPGCDLVMAPLRLRRLQRRNGLGAIWRCAPFTEERHAMATPACPLRLRQLLWGRLERGHAITQGKVISEPNLSWIGACLNFHHFDIQS